MIELPQVMVAPNGARKGKADHPALPVTLPEVLETARACHAAGAGGLHLHLRDGQGRHLLDTGAYQEALAALSHHLPDLRVQITTEAAGIYGPAQQRDVALNSGADMVSVSVREICRAPDAAPAFYAACRDRGITVQHILFDVADADLLLATLDRAGDHPLQLIYVLGRYTDGQVSSPQDLDPFLRWQSRLEIAPDWAICAFGPAETDCLLAAARRGGKCRIGFENNMIMRNGQNAPDNAARVAELVSLLPAA